MRSYQAAKEHKSRRPCPVLLQAGLAMGQVSSVVKSTEVLRDVTIPKLGACKGRSGIDQGKQEKEQVLGTVTISKPNSEPTAIAPTLEMSTYTSVA